MRTKPWLVALLTAVAGPALASDHLTVVQEVMLSYFGDGTAQYVELYDPGFETFPNGPYRLEVFDAQGQSVGSVQLPGMDDHLYYFVSTQSADTIFAKTGNARLDFALPAVGQACFEHADATKIHCLAWGCVQQVLPGATTVGPPPGDSLSLQRFDNGEARPRPVTPAIENWYGVLGLPCDGIFGDDFELGNDCEWSNVSCEAVGSGF